MEEFSGLAAEARMIFSIEVIHEGAHIGADRMEPFDLCGEPLEVPGITQRHGLKPG